jgi:pimeloyl-ACP methyl ester carboxylesterase
MDDNTAPRKVENDTPRLTRGALLRRAGLGAGTALAASALLSSPAITIAKAATAAKRSRKMQAKPNVVMVHGAWADASSWSKVIGLLQAAGYPVVAVQLGLTGLQNDIALVQPVLAAQSGPTVLVGHSYGGAVITGAGEAPP